VILKADQSAKKTVLGRVEGERIVGLDYKKARPYGIAPKNSGQYFLQEALMQSADRAPLVIVKGMAGTAKTFYSLAVGLEKLLNDPSGEYRKILISRPNAQFDSDIGFLPGDEQEKISPLMRPIIDNLEQLIDSCEEKRYENESELKGKIDEIFDRGLVQAEALNFIRGRSIVRTYLIIDEAQNMTPAQVKGIITRAGKGTKIILLGDPNQIDRSFLDERTNGLSYAAEHMKGSSLCWQITLCAEECQRSQLAMDAVKRMQ
ncbi:PhoH family protein, partial [Enterocloster citroniae]|nr:PhoH family protein [Enterocloster citroniae]